MTLQELYERIGYSAGTLPDVRVSAITEDSRRVTPGTVFVATSGEHYDGHEFVHEAVAAGATAVMGDREGLDEMGGVPYVCVKEPRKALGVLAQAMAGDPSQEMTVIGITGTNGKSSSAILAQHVLTACGQGAASIGTLGYCVGDTMQEGLHTTPFAEDLAMFLKRTREEGRTHVVMEVSSHALDQDRVAGIDFHVAAFTNLTQDHLDYHQDMDRYCAAKLKLFEMVYGPDSFTVVNHEDRRAGMFLKASKVPCITFGNEGDCRAETVHIDEGGTTFRVATPWGVAAITMRLPGKHNVSNALCVIAICGGLGLPLDRIAEAIGTMQCVPGRFEFVDAGQRFRVVVDYAHTEDGLRNVLQAARAICSGRIIVLVGCGGDRDRSKRPKMGAAAAAVADYTILTSDNPRTEDPERIILDIETGLQHTGKQKGKDYTLIVDRAEAIRRGIAMAQPGDMVLIAGKGHERYQIFGSERTPFDDREVARTALENRMVN